MNTSFLPPPQPLRPRLRDVFLGLWIASMAGSVVFLFLAWPLVTQAAKGEISRPEIMEAMIEPSVWTSFIIVLFELGWVARLVVVRGSGSFALDLGLRFELADVAWGILGWVAIFAGGELLDRFVIPIVVPGAVGDEPFNPLRPYAEVSMGLKLVMLLTIGFMVPLAEEMLFRGVLLRACSRWAGPVVGILVSSAIFGYLHATTWTARDLAYVFWATWAGIVLGVLRVGTDRLGAGIVAHLMQNSLIVALTIVAA